MFRSVKKQKVVPFITGDLQPSTEYTAELTYSDNNGPRTVTWKFTTGQLSSTIFVIEAEDFDYDGGQANPLKGTPGLDVNIMPYLGGAYDGISAVEGIDYNNDDAEDGSVYRTETDDSGGNEVSMYRSDNAAPGNGKGDVIAINGSERGSYTTVANYNIGWVGGGNWNNYTRNFPNNGQGGWWKVYAALSYGGDADGQLSGTLAKVTAGFGTPDQTTEMVGSFSAPGSGGWGANNLVRMKNASGGDALIKLIGTNTVRFNMVSGDFNFLIFSAAPPPPPFVESGPIDSTKKAEVVLDWTLRDTDSKVNASTIKVAIDGNDVTAKTTNQVTATGATIHLDMTGTEFTAGQHAWTITFLDNSSPAQSVTANGTFIVVPYPAERIFVIEAEDFNYSDDDVTGGKTNPQKGTPDLDVDVMPYIGGAYEGKSAVKGVDYNNADGNDSDVYRTEKDAGGENEVNITLSNGNRYSNDRGAFDLTSNYRIGWVAQGEWQNYTRTFPAGDYNVWAALSHNDRANGLLTGSLDLVTTDPTKPNQSTRALGTFSAPGSGGWGRNELVPMKGTNGQTAVVSMGGVQTVRFNLGGGDFDYLLFVPTEGTSSDRPAFTSVRRNGNGSLTVEWTGGGTLEVATSVIGPWSPVAGATSGYTFTPTASQTILFARIRKP